MNASVSVCVTAIFGDRILVDMLGHAKRGMGRETDGWREGGVEGWRDGGREGARERERE